MRPIALSRPIVITEGHDLMAENRLALWSLRALGVVIGFALVVGLEFLLVVVLQEAFNSRLIPRGLGWIVMPFAGAVFGYRVLPLLAPMSIVAALENQKTIKMVVGAIASWTVVVFGYILVVEPFSYRWDWEAILRWWLLPPICAAVIALIVGWTRR